MRRKIVSGIEVAKCMDSVAKSLTKVARIMGLNEKEVRHCALKGLRGRLESELKRATKINDAHLADALADALALAAKAEISR